MSKQLPILTPLAVSWKIDTTLSNVSVRLEEQQECLISMGVSYVERGSENFPRIEISTFIQWFNLELIDDVRFEILDPKIFDLSAIPRWIIDGSMKGKTYAESFLFFELFREKWKNAQICPDPGIYEIVGSSRPECEQFEAKHYCIIGREVKVEFISWNAKWRHVKTEDSIWSPL